MKRFEIEVRIGEVVIDSLPVYGVNPTKILAKKMAADHGNPGIVVPPLSKVPAGHEEFWMWDNKALFVKALN